MTGKALICKLGEHIPIEGADRIVQVNMFGETVITQKTNEEGTVGLLFDMETALSHEYASKNNMYRHSHLNEDKTVTGYLEDDRRIRGVRLKGVKCSALFMPLNSILAMIGKDHTEWNNSLIGTEINEWDGIPICEKYIPKATKKAMGSNKEGRVSVNLVPTFKEHIDTDQWGRNMHKIEEGNLVIVTEKFHGTSGRCGYLRTIKKTTLRQRIAGWLGTGRWMKSYNTYKFVVGSRRVVKSIGGQEHGNKQHFYEEDLWTKVSKEHFEGKLKKGETVYFEIVGYTPSGELIMPSVSNKKLEKFMDKKEYKEFISRYGETTTFSYGCTKDDPYKVFIYRITLTNEDGDSVDLSWDQVKRRSEQLNVPHVPELFKGLMKDRSDVVELESVVNYDTDDQSKLFPEHIREGVCIRIENGSMVPLILKNKSFIFKVLEGIIKDSDVVDLEESQG